METHVELVILVMGAVSVKVSIVMNQQMVLMVKLFIAEVGAQPMMLVHIPEVMVARVLLLCISEHLSVSKFILYIKDFASFVHFCFCFIFTLF
jgi:hypothetical protein